MTFDAIAWNELLFRRYVLSYVCRAYPDKMSPNTRIYITYQYRAARSLPPELFSFTFHCLFVVVVAVAVVVVVVGSYKFYRNLCAISWFFMCAFGCGRFKCVCLFPTTDFKWKWKWKESKRTFNLEMQHWGIFTCNFDCSSLFFFSPFFCFCLQSSRCLLFLSIQILKLIFTINWTQLGK